MRDDSEGTIGSYRKTNSTSGRWWTAAPCGASKRRGPARR